MGDDNRVIFIFLDRSANSSQVDCFEQTMEVFFFFKVTLFPLGFRKLTHPLAPCLVSARLFGAFLRQSVADKIFSGSWVLRKTLSSHLICAVFTRDREQQRVFLHNWASTRQTTHSLTAMQECTTWECCTINVCGSSLPAFDVRWVLTGDPQRLSGTLRDPQMKDFGTTVFMTSCLTETETDSREPARRLTDRLIHLITDSLSGWLTDSLTRWGTGPIPWLKDWPTDSLNDRFSRWLTDWSTVRLTEQWQAADFSLPVLDLHSYWTVLLLPVCSEIVALLKQCKSPTNLQNIKSKKEREKDIYRKII